MNNNPAQIKAQDIDNLFVILVNGYNKVFLKTRGGFNEPQKRAYSTFLDTLVEQYSKTLATHINSSVSLTILEGWTENLVSIFENAILKSDGSVVYELNSIPEILDQQYVSMYQKNFKALSEKFYLESTLVCQPSNNSNVNKI